MLATASQFSGLLPHLLTTPACCVAHLRAISHTSMWHQNNSHMPVASCHETASQPSNVPGSYDSLAAVHVCMRENVWRGTLAFPHILPHAHMMSVSSITGCACVHEGECVEGHTCLFTCLPSCTHDICVISNWPCMCAWGRMCGGACLPFHLSSLMHTCHLPHL